MTGFRLLAVALTGLLLLAPGPLLAEGKPPLETGQIEGFIASYPKMLKLGEQFAAEMREHGDPKDPFGAAVSHMMASPARAQFQNIVTSHGFSDIASWAEIGNRVMMSYAMIESGTNAQQMSQQMEMIRQQIESNPNLTDDQKKAALNQISASSGAMLANMPSDEDMAAVKPYVPQIKTLVDKY